MRDPKFAANILGDGSTGHARVWIAPDLPFGHMHFRIALPSEHYVPFEIVASCQIGGATARTAKTYGHKLGVSFGPHSDPSLVELPLLTEARVALAKISSRFEKLARSEPSIQKTFAGKCHGLMRSARVNYLLSPDGGVLRYGGVAWNHWDALAGSAEERLQELEQQLIASYKTKVA